MLGNIIQSAQERERLASELGVRPITLMRWAHGESSPRPYSLRQLLNALPEQQRKELLPLLSEEFSEISLIVKEDSTEGQLQEIPPEFYSRVISTYLTTPEAINPWALRNLILQQVLLHLDPDRLGMAATVAQCIPPLHGNKVRSLRVIMGRGSPPWESDLEQRSLFLGAETLAGYAVVSLRSFVVQQPYESNLLPEYRTTWETSQVVCPIMRLNMVAGCLLVSSTQPDYFQSFHQKLIQDYANLLALTFKPEEFYAVQDIELLVMPEPAAQSVILSTFRNRVVNFMIDHRPLSVSEAEQLVWQQLEEEMLQLHPKDAK